MLNAIAHYLKAYDELHTLISLYPELRDQYCGANRYLKYHALVNAKMYINSGGDSSDFIKMAEEMGLSQAGWNFAYESGYLAVKQPIKETMEILQDVMEQSEEASILLANLALLISTNDKSPMAMTQLVDKISTCTVNDNFTESNRALLLELAQAQQLRLIQPSATMVNFDLSLSL